MLNSHSLSPAIISGPSVEGLFREAGLQARNYSPFAEISINERQPEIKALMAHLGMGWSTAENPDTFELINRER